jgi:hypothetical protein
LNVAATARNAASFAGSLTFECNITFELPSFGSLCAGPMSISPGGAIRRAKSGKCSRDHRGDAAADKALAPSDAGLVERAYRNRPDAAGRGERRKRQRLALGKREASRGEPAELVFGQLLATAAAAFLADDHSVELARVIGILHLAREANRDGERQVR